MIIWLLTLAGCLAALDVCDVASEPRVSAWLEEPADPATGPITVSAAAASGPGAALTFARVSANDLFVPATYDGATWSAALDLGWLQSAADPLSGTVDLRFEVHDACGRISTAEVPAVAVCGVGEQPACGPVDTGL